MGGQGAAKERPSQNESGHDEIKFVAYHTIFES